MIDRRVRSFVVALVGAAVLISASAVSAQDGRLTVVLVDDVGFDVENAQVIQEGIEDIVAQFGEFELVPAAALESALAREDRRALEDCRTEAACYADVLLAADVDFALVAVLYDQGGEYAAELSGMNLHDPGVLGFMEGTFPEPAETLFLLVPVFESISPLAEVEIPADPPPRARDRVSDRVRDRGSDTRDRASDRASATRDRASDRASATRDRASATRDRARDTNPLLADPPGGSGTNVLATALTVGGGALIGTGLVFWLLADDTQLEIQSTPHETAELEELQSTGESQATIGNISVITGAVALTTGIVFHLTGIGAPSAGGNDSLRFHDDYDVSSNGVRVGVGGTPTSPTLNLSMDF